MKRDEPTTAPHNRECREAFVLLLLAWPYFLAKGIWMERQARKAGSR